MDIIRTYWKIIVPVVLVILIAVGLMSFTKKDTIVVTEEVEEPVVAVGDYFAYDEPADASPITGASCANHDKRTFGVMFNGDRGARQYFSNVSLADFVAEVPHRAEHGQPRILAVYGCNTPEIVGPMRSGRVDHISIATSLDAVYVPWGGSSISKALLKKGVTDHIDCNGEVAPGGGSACFRRGGPMSQLEKASTTIPGLIEVAQANGYRSESNFAGFAHQGDAPIDARPNYAKVNVKYEDPYRVEYLYDKDTNSYMRYFQNAPDIDFETKTQHAPKNVITIIAKKESWRKGIDYVGQGLQDPWAGVPSEDVSRDSGQYPNMQLGDPWFDKKHEGEAQFFFNGQRIKGTWKREKSVEAPFEFFDADGAPVRFAPGQIWLHILGHTRRISYEDEAEYLKKQEKLKAAPAAAL